MLVPPAAGKIEGTVLLSIVFARSSAAEPHE